jgi:DnaK suppressor protein
VAKKTTAKSVSTAKSPKKGKPKKPAPAAKSAAKTAPKSAAKPVSQPTKVAVKPAKPAPTVRQIPVTVVRPADNNGTLPGRLSEEDLKKAKSGLTRKDLEHYWILLMQKRAEILGDVASLETDARNNGGNLSNMPLHMADIGTDNYDQEFTLGLVESERKLLMEINEALLRIKAGTFGVCLATGKPIGKPRLEIKPWAKFCIEVARDLEKRGRAV